MSKNNKLNIVHSRVKRTSKTKTTSTCSEVVRFHQVHCVFVLCADRSCFQLEKFNIPHDVFLI